MRRSFAVTALALLALLALSAPVAADTGGVRLTATLTGAAQAPAPGDPDGSGTAVLRLNPGLGEVCYDLTVQNIEEPMEPAPGIGSAHIHAGPAGVAGPVVVNFEATWVSTDGGFTSSGCVDADRELIVAIIMNPEQYYVNVHNHEYPGGAVRGQLSK
jgi:hypothetical protein